MTAIRNTIQRQIVLDTVFELKNHPTADEVYATIYKTHPSISRGTVYRNLNTLTMTGKVLKISVPDSADRFDHNTHNHYHVKCKGCGCFIDVDIPNIDIVKSVVSEKTNFVIDDCSIVFTGTCSHCSQNKH